MSKSSPSPPPAPNPTTVANAQSKADINTAIAQGTLNNVNQVTPYGNLTYSQTGSYDVNGNKVPQYTATQTLTPAAEQALQQQQQLTGGLYGLANSQLNRIDNAVSQPFDMSKVATLPNSANQYSTDAANAIFGQAKQNLDPQFAEEQSQLQDQLSRQGIPVGSQAYSQSLADFNRSKNNAYATAQNSATTEGYNVGQQQLAGQEGLAQQQIQQQNFTREQPLNEAIALMGGGQIQNPSFTNTPQEQVAPTDVTGAYALQQSALNNNYNQQVANNSAAQGGMFGLGGSALGALGSFAGSPAGSAALLAISDRRSKEDITKVGELFDGSPVYRFRYIGNPQWQIGLMAQDVQEREPEAVQNINGLLHVNYHKATENSVKMARGSL